MSKAKVKSVKVSIPASKVMSIADMTAKVKELPSLHDGSTGTANVPVKLYIANKLISEGTGSEVFQEFGGKATANTLKSLTGKLSKIEENIGLTVEVKSLDNVVIYSALNGVQAKLKSKV